MKEIWKYIPYTNNHYSASNLGRIRSNKRLINRTVNGHHEHFTRKGHILTPSVHSHKRARKYLCVGLTINNHTKICLIHDLVAQAFLPNPHHYRYVCHRNHNTEDNRVNNLCYSNHRQSDLAQRTSITISRGYFSKTFSSVKSTIKWLWRNGKTSAHYNTVRKAIKLCCNPNGKYNTIYGYKVQYTRNVNNSKGSRKK